MKRHSLAALVASVVLLSGCSTGADVDKDNDPGAAATSQAPAKASPASASPAADRDSFTGTWRGPVTGDSSAYEVVAVITNTDGRLSAEVDYPQIDCEARWQETSAGEEGIAFVEELLSGQCLDGSKVTLARSGSELTAQFSSTQSAEVINSVMSPEADRADPEVGTARFDLTHRDGYKMSFTVIWHQVTDTPGEELNAVARSQCLKRMAITNPGGYSFKTVRVSVEVDRPEVNGFQWPEGIMPSLRLNTGSLGFTCGFGIAEADPPFTMAVPGETVLIRREQKTPNNPEGKFDLDLSQLTISTGSDSCTVTGAEDIPETVGGNSRCEVAYPG